MINKKEAVWLTFLFRSIFTVIVLCLGALGCGTLQPFNLEDGSKTCHYGNACFQFQAWDGPELVYTSKPGYGWCEPENNAHTPARWMCKWWVKGKYLEKTFPPSFKLSQRRMSDE